MKIVYKILIVVLSLFIIDFAIGAICKKMLHSIPDNGSPLAVDYHVLFEEKSDVIIMGASQVKHGYDTRVFSDSLAMSVYNTAQDGIDVIQNYIYLKAIFERRPPHIVVLDIFPAYLDGSMKYRIRNMNNWYGLSSPVTEYFNQRPSWQEKIKLKSSLYVNNSILCQLLRTKLKAEETIKGFSPMKGTYTGERFTDNRFTLDDEELQYLNKIVELCDNNQTKLIMTQAPNYTLNNKYKEWLTSYCDKKHLTLLNHVDDECFLKHANYFRDSSHLNEKGAEEFSKQLVSEIKATLK